MIRRRYRRRAPFRRVLRGRVMRRRRIPRPIGSGQMGKRFFKMRFQQAVNLTVAAAGTAVYNGTFDNNPSQAIDFASMANLFDEYKVCAMKITFVPSITANANILANYVPMYVMHDPNSTTAPVTAINNFLSYENCKYFNVQRPWKYYRKMQQNIPTNSSWTTQRNINTRGYLQTDSPIPTQAIFVILNAQNWQPTTPSSQQIGTMVTTWYIVARSRL